MKHPQSANLRYLAHRSSNAEYLNALLMAADELDRLYQYSPERAMQALGGPARVVSGRRRSMKILCDCGATLVDVEAGVIFDADYHASALHTCGCKATWFISVSASGVGISPAVGTERASLVTQGTPDSVFTILKRPEPAPCQFVNDESGQFSFSTVLSANWNIR